MKNLLFIYFSLLLIISLASAQKKKTVATIFKPVGTVEYKTGNKEWTKAKPATPLNSGDIVRTGENSFAIIKFLENSVVRVQEKSEVTISGEIAKGEFSKNVHIERGEVGFNVKKRPNEKFEFSTPTSVASIRGTSGLFIIGPDSNDIFILGSGTIDFLNLISKLTSTITGGQTIFSFSDGTIKVQNSTPEEQRLLREALPDTGKSEGMNIPIDSGSTSATGIKIGMAISVPVSKENHDMPVTIEITNSSITLDSIKNMSPVLTLFYRKNANDAFKQITAQLSGRKNSVSIPAKDVFAPAMFAYAALKLNDGSEFTTPAQSPELNAYALPVQATKRNEIRIEFTDPNGKKKTLVIEYK